MNLRLSPDSPEVHERLTFLDRFLEAVGENPPDELVGLSREVHQAYHKARPQMEQTLGAGPFLSVSFVFFGGQASKPFRYLSKSFRHARKKNEPQVPSFKGSLPFLFTKNSTEPCSDMDFSPSFHVPLIYSVYEYAQGSVSLCPKNACKWFESHEVLKRATSFRLKWPDQSLNRSWQYVAPANDLELTTGQMIRV